MSSKSKYLEIVYNLRWKNKPGNGGDKTSMVGIYDIPATTLNWEVFKSYLLKNAGSSAEDVKISYITESGKEYPIQSQTDFQVALYAFRRKARDGHLINLILENIANQPTHKNVRHSNDVETQIDNNEASSIVSTCCGSGDTAPDWFIGYMNQFKKEITEELTATVTSVVSTALSNLKPQVVSQPAPCYHSRKSKDGNNKRRKHHSYVGEAINDTKHLLKTLKHERKLDDKLETLESKTKKLREKKLALFNTKSSDSDAGHSSSHRHDDVDGEENMKAMDGKPIKAQTVVPHMLGGEIYLHQWEVINCGSAPWTSKTFLQFTWGSKALEPVEKVITVPYLRPGEKGVICVRLQIPNEPGHYECYWHFMHKGRRFGQWLGCQVVVDPFDLKGTKSVLETTALSDYGTPSDNIPYSISNAIRHYPTNAVKDAIPETSTKCLFNIDQYIHSQEVAEQKLLMQDEIEECSKNVLDELLNDVSARVEDLKLLDQDPTDTNCSSDSDNYSVLSIPLSLPSELINAELDDQSGSPVVEKNEEENNKPSTSTPAAGSCDDNNNSPQNSSDNDSEKNDMKHDKDMVIVYMPKGEGEDNEKEADDQDMVYISMPKDQKHDGYVCVHVEGQMVHIPKKILKSVFIPTASKPSSPTNSTEAANIEKQEKPTNMGKTLEGTTVDVHPLLPNFSTEHPAPAAMHQSDLTIDGPLQKIEDEANCGASHCSAAGSSFSDFNQMRNTRLFVFPQDSPGYEIPCTGSFVPVAQNYMNGQGGTSISTSAPPLNLTTHDRTTSATEEQPATERTYVNQAYINVAISNDNPNTSSSNRAEPDVIPPSVSVSTSTSTAIGGESRSTTATAPQQEAAHLQQQGRRVNEQYVSPRPTTTREANLQALAEMGFWNFELNAALLEQFSDDLNRVVSELVQ